MMAAQIHRGPDGEGAYYSPSGCCLLGHRRLSILDLTEAAAQPMVSESGGQALTYNGECYNFPELRQELEARGEHPRSTGDTEVLLRLLTREGRACLLRLNAMFAFGFWDEPNRRLLLARDRFGQKPLYYAQVGDLFLFASEVRALLASGLIDRRVDPESILGYLSFGAIQGPGTIVRGIRLLPAGYYLELSSENRVEIGAYWQPSREKRPCSYEELREAFQMAVRRHLTSDAPVGLFLSGGIDSSSVAAAAVRAQKQPPVTLSVVFPDQPAQSEVVYARHMAQLIGSEHREIPIVGHQMLRFMPQVLEAMDQPTYDSTNVWVVSYAAHQAGLKVALSGTGGDELFGGYPVFRDLPRWVLWQRCLKLLGRPGAVCLNHLMPFSRLGGKLASLIDSPKGLVDVYCVRRQLFSRCQITALAPSLSQLGSHRALRSEYKQSLDELVRDRPISDGIGLLEMYSYLGQILLRDSDVMGMVHGLEIRMPLLDADFASRVLAMEPATRIPNSTPKHTLVEAMGDWLPEEIWRRPKQGFDMPFRVWMRHELREQIRAGLDGLDSLGGFFNAKTVSLFWRRFEQAPGSVGWARPWALSVLGHYLKCHSLGL